MKIKILAYYGVYYLVPEEFEFINVTPGEHPSFCGAGNGIGDIIVPETMWGLRCSHICHIHDESWDIADDSIIDFALSNAMFLFNLVSYCMHTGNIFTRYARCLRSVTYFTAVNTIGYDIFDRIKKGQIE